MINAEADILMEPGTQLTSGADTILTPDFDQLPGGLCVQAPSTFATIIVTVDGTGYTGPITIGAMELTLIPPGPGGGTPTVFYQTSGITRQNTPIPGHPEYDGIYYYETILQLNQNPSANQQYMIYAMADSTDEVIGGALTWYATDPQPVTFVIHGEEYDG